MTENVNSHQDSVINFWGIGAQKSGTTWLFDNLSRQPGFDMPPIKEMHYFDRGLAYPTYSPLMQTWLMGRMTTSYLKENTRKILSLLKKRKVKEAMFYTKWYLGNYDDDWYLSLFKSFKGITGEMTPSYAMLTREDITGMYNISPNAKLIFIMRNPIDRAWSHYRHRTKIDVSLKNATTDQIMAFLESKNQTVRSDYIATIKNFSDVFPKKQILICFYDAIIDSPDRLLSEVVKFIKGDSIEVNPTGDAHQRINDSVKLNCPNKVYDYLKGRYHDQIKRLATLYGGYCNKWYADVYKKHIPNVNKTLLPTTFIR